jgi:multidrug resistance efflux pump
MALSVPDAVLPAANPVRTRFPWALAAVLATGLVVILALQPPVIVAQSGYVYAHRVEVVPVVTGLVTEVAVGAGDVIKQGQVIARIDDTEAHLRLQQAEARLGAAREADKAVAQADLALAREQLATYVVRAPRAGTVATCSLEPGDYAPAGTAIATLISTGPTWINAQVGERDVTALHLGAAAHVRLAAFPGQSWEGRVSQIGNHAKKDKSRDGSTLLVRITLDALPASVLPDMTAAVSIDR